MPSVFDMVRAGWPDKVTARDLGKRPVCSRCSDARVLDPHTAIVADCEPGDFRTLVREWHDRRTAEHLAEAVHQLELERAAQPPVIEVTVTTPPGGISRLELDRAVAEKVSEFAVPRRVLAATRRARDQLVACDRPVAISAWIAEPARLVFPVSEDGTPTEVLPFTGADGDVL